MCRVLFTLISMLPFFGNTSSWSLNHVTLARGWACTLHVNRDSTPSPVCTDFPFPSISGPSTKTNRRFLSFFHFFFFLCMIYSVEVTFKYRIVDYCDDEIRVSWILTIDNDGNSFHRWIFHSVLGQTLITATVVFVNVHDGYVVARDDHVAVDSLVL